MNQDKNRNNLADFNLFAVSAGLKETALNTFQTLDTGFLVDKGMIMTKKRKSETDAGLARGMEEESELFFLGDSFEYGIKFPMMQAQHLAFGLAYALGACASTAYGIGRAHAITPLLALDMPGFSAAQRYGKTIGKRRAASNYIDQLSLACARDAWATLDLSIKATGKHEDTVYEEKVSAAYNVVSLTLAANGVAGADAPERLANIHAVYAIDPVGGQRVYTEPTAASVAVPAVISVTAIPASDITVTDWYIQYVPVEPAWATFPAKIDEPPLRTTDCSLVVGGKLSAGDIVGGYAIQEDIKTLTYQVTNAMDMGPRMGGTGTYSNHARRGGRQQIIKLDQEMRNWILEREWSKGSYFGAKISLLGAEFETGKNYGGTLIFPRLGIVDKTISVDGKVLAEAGDLRVLEDGTNLTAYAKVWNLETSYAQ